MSSCVGTSNGSSESRLEYPHIKKEDIMDITLIGEIAVFAACCFSGWQLFKLGRCIFCAPVTTKRVKRVW